ncbi:allergen Tab y 5.0101 [Scaptodrosophila lebanonensis]|uniref:Allergen Tab y 5.0101 n=1 Tax=Drosophila lebanonensis TaxID=7225 RepID=A0A6J2TFC6_DROLE|nr:allergen Tab y 5.0101 [Scaptodrosophila lebanonensis]
MGAKSLKYYFLSIFCLWAANVNVNGNLHKTSYCMQRYCGSKNLACNNHGNYSNDCVPSSRTIPLSKHRNGLLNVFNELRNKLAGGHIGSHLPAARMARMSWSNELEYLAHLAVLNCRENVKYCLSSPDFHYIGSNINQFSYGGKVSIYTNFEIMLKLIDKWTSEMAFVNKDATLYVPDHFPNDKVVQSALLMMDRNTHVGCAALRYSIEYYNHFLFCCTFATDVIKHKPLYKLSGKPGSACQNRDTTYTNLCAVGEVYGNEHAIAHARVYRSPTI